MWKEYFENPLGNSPKVTNIPITKSINCRLDIKVEQFTHNELNEILRRIKNRKDTTSTRMSSEELKTREFDDLHFRFSNSHISRIQVRDRKITACSQS